MGPTIEVLIRGHKKCNFVNKNERLIAEQFDLELLNFYENEVKVPLKMYF